MTLAPTITTRPLPFQMSCAQIHDAMLAHVRAEFERRAMVKPTWFVQIPGQFMTVVTDWGDEREKQIHITAIEHLLAVAKASAYSFACEAWVSTYSEEEATAPDFQPPSEREQRDDIAMVTTFMRDGPHLVSRFLVMAASTPRAKLGLQVDAGEALTGNLFNLFNRHRARSVKETKEGRGQT